MTGNVFGQGDAIPKRCPGGGIRVQGHVAVEVSSSGESVLYLSDAILHPLHIEHADWLPVYMLDSSEFQESSRRLLYRAVETNALVLGMHFPPFPSLGRVIASDDGFRWQPMPPHG